MDLTRKTALCQELRDLLAQWEIVSQKQAALETEYTSLRNQIVNVCGQLDQFDGAAQ